MTKNPWLEISASDYVNHMSSPYVLQYQMINECFKTALQKYNPKNIFIPGCTIGNGLEHIDWNKLESVTVLDINKSYLELIARHFGNNKKLEIMNQDIMKFNTTKKFDLIFAALLFEYIEIIPVIEKMKSSLDPNAILYVILQLPVENLNKISETKYKSLQKLSTLMKLVSVEEFQDELKKIGMTIISTEKIDLQSGKSFQVIESTYLKQKTRQ